MLELGDGCIQALDYRDGAHADQAVRVHGAVFFGEPVVVCADERHVGTVVADASPEWRADRTWKQHFGVDAVLVLFSEPLLR